MNVLHLKEWSKETQVKIKEEEWKQRAEGKVKKEKDPQYGEEIQGDTKWKRKGSGRQWKEEDRERNIYVGTGVHYKKGSGMEKE